MAQTRRGDQQIEIPDHPSLPPQPSTLALSEFLAYTGLRIEEAVGLLRRTSRERVELVQPFQGRGLRPQGEELFSALGIAAEGGAPDLLARWLRVPKAHER